MVRVSTNGLGDLGSIPGQVIPKTQNVVLDASLLNTQHYNSQIKGKRRNSEKLVASSPTLQCSSYRKESLWVALDYGWPTYLYLGCTNTEHLRRNDNINSFVHTKNISHFIYTIYQQVVLKGKNTQCLNSKNHVHSVP